MPFNILQYIYIPFIILILIESKPVTDTAQIPVYNLNSFSPKILETSKFRAMKHHHKNSSYPGNSHTQKKQILLATEASFRSNLKF